MAKPEIRLKGFKGEWERDSFTNTFRFLKNNSLSRADLNYEDGKVRNVHYGDVLIKFGELLDVSHSLLPYITNKEIADRQDKENLLQNGDIVFADAAEDNTVGKCSEIQGLGLTDNVVSGLHTIPCRPIRQFEKGYLGYFLNSNSYHDQLLPMIQGTKVCGISKGNLNLTTITYPNNKEEQVALADYFKSLDSVIQGVTKKIASLKQMKQACLVSMFPQAGETTPRVRFKGFKGEWEDVSFKDITYLSGTKNRDNLPLESYSISNEKGFVPQNEQFEQGGTMTNADKRLYYIVTPDSFAYNPARINVGSIGYDDLDKDVIVSSLYVVFKTDDKTNNYFLNHWFKTPMFRNMIELYQEGGVRLYFFYDKLCQCHFRRPSLAEQDKIASFFTSLDKQISLQEARLEKLKQIKAACLDKMFV